MFLGSNAVRFDGVLNAGGGRAIAQTTTAGGGASSALSGKMYVFTGAYWTSEDLPAGLEPQIQIQVGSSYALVDGRDWTTTNTRLPLRKTPGAWRRFSFYFLAPADGHITARAIAYNSFAGRAGTIRFDDLRISRVYRWEYHEPLLAIESVPAHEEGRLGIFFERWMTGAASLSLVNKDGRLETWASQFEVPNKKLFVRWGGKFLDGGNEILPEDMETRLWLTRKVTVTDTLGQFELEDARTIFLERLPNRYLNTSLYANMAATDVGRPRAIACGEIDNVKPGRVNNDANGAPIYELLDPAYRVHSSTIGTVVSIHAYLDEEAAAWADAARRRAVDVALTVTLASNGQVSFTTPPAAIEIRAGENEVLDFDEGGGALVGSVTPGVYLLAEANDGRGLLKQIDNALDAAGATYDVTYSTSTKKATVARSGGGTFNIRLTSAAVNRDQSAWRAAGFNGSVDRTGASSYDGDVAIYTDPDAQCIVRVKFTGYYDDASGTYTGSPTVPIQKWGTSSTSSCERCSAGTRR